jgi:hypothetical protein
MIAVTDQYLAALVKHDPAGLPLSRGVRFTENTAEIRIGDGVWVGASEAHNNQDLCGRFLVQSGWLLWRHEGKQPAAHHLR